MHARLQLTVIATTSARITNMYNGGLEPSKIGLLEGPSFVLGGHAPRDLSTGNDCKELLLKNN
jgi:hypothetical protein